MDQEDACLIIHDLNGGLCCEKGFKNVSQEVQTIYTVELFFGLTSNGGFQSFFFGAYQEVAPYIVDSLKRVKLFKYASIVEGAIYKLFPEGIPLCEDAYEQKIDEIYEQFEESELAEELDDPFEQYEEGFWELYDMDGKSFRPEMMSYILKHKQAFTNQ